MTIQLVLSVKDAYFLSIPLLVRKVIVDKISVDEMSVDKVS